MKQISQNKTSFFKGMRHGVPIFLGYFVVSFSLGIAAANIGLNALQGFLASFLNHASAGQYAGFTAIAADAAYFEIALVTLITNSRYLLMSASLSQHFSPNTPFIHRLGVAYALTDEIFSISINSGKYLNPFYSYGAFCVASPGWCIGTVLGILAGNILPVRFVSALSVALYGMFLAIVIPVAKKNKVIAGLVIISFICSFAFSKIPLICELNLSTRIIILTVVISLLAALFFPIKEEHDEP